MIFNKKRKEKAQSFTENNKDRAIVHLYCRNTKINGRPISEFHPTTGENLQKIVALDSGEYSFEGIFEATDTRLTKSINLKNRSYRIHTRSSGRAHIYGGNVYEPTTRFG